MGQRIEIAADPDRARVFARQVAETMWAAHQRHLLPADLKVGDFTLAGHGQNRRIILPALDASRPRLQPSVRAEIYLFGQILGAILPGHRLVAECTAADPYERPDSLEIVIEELQDISTRRTWIGSLLIGAAASSLYLYQKSLPPAHHTSPATQGW